MGDIARPEDLVTFQWVIITILVAVVGYLWRELRKCDSHGREELKEFLTKTLTGLSEINEVLGSLVRALEAYQEQLGVDEQLRELRSEIRRNETTNSS